MKEKTIKIVLEDEAIEYKLEENTSLILEVQNSQGVLNVNKKEKVDKILNKFNQVKFDNPKGHVVEHSYEPKQYTSSIFDVLNNNVSQLNNNQSDEIDNTFEGDHTYKEVKEKEEKTLVDSVKEHQIKDKKPKNEGNLLDSLLDKYSTEKTNS